ncbi:uncharacterized protein LOC128236390 [Mya arenaria]|nr:uncharacterized protein LOC128236390 [Mya arenaria]
MGWTSFYFIAFGLHCGFAVSLVGASALKGASVPCGDTFCQQPGYEACLLPPKVTNAFCCPCERFEDPCDRVTPQQGCHLFCQDKVIVERDKECNKTMAELERQRQDLRGSNQREIGKYRDTVLELQRRIQAVVGVAGLTGSLALIVLVAGTLFYLCRRRLKTKPREGPSGEPENPDEVTLLKSVASSYVTNVSEDSGEGSGNYSSAGSISSGDATPSWTSSQPPTCTPVLSGSSLGNGQCRDGRLTMISPTQGDTPKFCPS